MHSKTKIVVLHLRELIYTAIFAILGILFIVLLILMFLPKENDTGVEDTATALYVPGVYTTSLLINDNVIDIEVVVDDNNINSIRLVNLDEAVATMYPLIEPTFQDLSAQIYETQSLSNITFSDERKYTSTVLLEAISASIEKASH